MKYIISTSILPYFDKKTVVAGFEMNANTEGYSKEAQEEILQIIHSRLATDYALARSEGRKLIELDIKYINKTHALCTATYELPNSKTIVHTFTIWKKID